VPCGTLNAAWDGTNCLCKAPNVFVDNKACCSPGGRYDAAQNKCVCPVGTNWDETTKRCIGGGGWLTGELAGDHVVTSDAMQRHASDPEVQPACSLSDSVLARCMHVSMCMRTCVHVYMTQSVS
jgi:hypothetical protein